MRIIDSHIAAFGQLRQVSFGDLDHPVVVFLGPNEAGKSTCFHFFKTMLYGIYPVAADQHAYVPRDGVRMEGSLTYRLANGAGGRVARKLMSTPWGRHAQGSAEHDLGNHTLPAVKHVPRGVFESVYALSLYDMAALKDAAWQEVQDRLLGSLGVDYVHPARLVTTALDDEANSLWRPDRRGRPVVREKEKQVRALKKALTEALQRDEALRSLNDDVEEHVRLIASLEEEQTRLTLEKRRIDELTPVRKLLSKIEQKRQEAGDVDRWRDVPVDPREAIHGVEARLEEIHTEQAATEKAVAAAQETLAAYTDSDARVIAQKIKINTWVKKAETHQQAVRERDRLRQEVVATERGLAERCDALLTEPWDDALAERLRSFSEADLRQKIRAYEEAADRLAGAEGRYESLQLSAGERQSVVPGLVALGLGIALLTAGLLTQIDLLGFGGVLLVGIGGALWFVARRHNVRQAERRERVDLDVPRREAERRGEAVADVLRGVPLPEGRARKPDRDLLDDLRTLREKVDHLTLVRERLDEAAQRIERDIQAVQALAAACGLDRQEEVVPSISRMEQALAEAVERHRAAERAKEQEDDATKALKRLGEETLALETRHTRLLGQLAEIGDGDAGRGMEELARRREAAREAEHHRRTLAEEYPDWEDRRDRIERLEAERGAWPYSEESGLEIDRRLEALGKSLREEEKALGRNRAELKSLEEKPGAGAVASEIEYLESEIDDLCRRRDRLSLLARIITRADHTFRLKHQPDVIRRASRYLQQITGGRYERLIVEEGEQALKIYEMGDPFPQLVGEPLSQGTRDQIYLSLRFAIVDHLDEGQERLPVFLDEVFVNWDADRRRAGLELLRELADHRQVFLFSCHPWFAHELAHHLDARVVTLGEGADASAPTLTMS